MRCGRNANRIIKQLLAVTISLGLSGTSKASTGIPWSPELLAWYECGDKLALDKTVSVSAARSALTALSLHSVDPSPEFLKLAASVVAAESGFNSRAVSGVGAYGLMQVTIIGAKEAAIQCRLPYSSGVSDETLVARLMDSRANVKYGTCLLRYYLDQVKGNHTLALVLYNGGYAQLTRLINTGTLTKETQDYVLRVNSYLGRCL